MNRGMKTLTQFLIEERRRFPAATGELNGLILSIAVACKSIATHVGHGAFAAAPGAAARQPLEALANEIFQRCVEWGGHAAAMMSGQTVTPFAAAPGTSGKYLVVFDALDGAPDIELNVSVGSLFSILRAGAEDSPAGAVTQHAFLQRGAAQVAAGYAIYGPSTMLVLTVGNGTHGFTLERSIGEFMLTHPDLRIPAATSQFAIDSSNSRFWEAPVRRYVAECLLGAAGARERDFEMRWVASLVADAHRILMRGGVFLNPWNRLVPQHPGGVRLLSEANPIAFLVEQAGGRASTGRLPVLGVEPAEIHQRAGLVFGSREEVERVESYHRDDLVEAGIDLPLFQSRGLFRDSLVA